VSTEHQQAVAGSPGAGDGVRLQKLLAQAGLGSRRVGDELVAAGRVKVNGEVARPGRRVDPQLDSVEVDGVPVAVRPGLVHYLLNKPAGVVSTASDPESRPTVVSLVPDEPRVHPVGRLDADSEGLILLTNDGDLTHRLTHPSYGVEKEYLAHVGGGALRPHQLRALRDGILLDDGMTAPARVSQPSPGVLRIIIHEGRNRQVRRMCSAVGHPVLRLLRVRIGPLRDPDLGPGQWRPLRNAELHALQAAAVAVDPDAGSERFAPRRGADVTPPGCGGRALR